MSKTLRIYNTLTRQKEDFEPLNPPFVGLYNCGPTVYGPPHLGHARAGITYDVVFRFMKNTVIGPGYKVRYVRNITDVGHLEDEVAGAGEDKILKKARLEKLEPMEVVQKYVLSYHEAFARLNMLPPSIEPTASGHIIEQIEMVKRIMEKGLAYEVEGNVYFDIEKYNEGETYGELSGRVLEDLMSSDRVLDGQEVKRNKFDFALWKKAEPEHIMKWPSPWGVGFPGWHLECSVMSTKYLGQQFDIHGGGMDLLFPHHECEIAQSKAADGQAPVRYWMHHNMITLDGQKMAKSLGNSIFLEQFFTGEHDLLEQAYTPMCIRFFMLQSHYKSTLDFSNAALQAADKGLHRLLNSYKVLQDLAYKASTVSEGEDAEVNKLCDQCTEHMNDDFNTAQTVARLFDLSKKINSYKEGVLDIGSISQDTFGRMKATFNTLVDDVLALNVQDQSATADATDGLMDLVLNIRKEAREKKDWGTSDLIRDHLEKLDIVVKDGKDGSSWNWK